MAPGGKLRDPHDKLFCSCGARFGAYAFGFAKGFAAGCGLGSVAYACCVRGDLSFTESAGHAHPAWVSRKQSRRVRGLQRALHSLRGNGACRSRARCEARKSLGVRK